MLSTITSFLPSALHINTNSDLPRPTVTAEDAVTDDEEDGVGRSVVPQMDVGDQPSKGKDKTPNETFIFVRPPPSKSNHPLNLQVQLVPPNVKPPSGVADAATTPTSATSVASTNSDGASLKRTNSNRSTSSFNANSYSSSTASFSSVASTSTNSSSRRTIIPLYNLQAHNVMTNVIVDAGTDAKIAKFQKRGIELIDVALLEPVEVWGDKDPEKSQKEARRESMRISIDEAGAMVTNVSNRGSLISAKSIGTFLQPGGGSRPVTPSAASSSASLHSHSQVQHQPSNLNPTSNGQVQTPRKASPPSLASQTNEITSPTPITSPPSKRNIFGKLFNKRNSVVTPPSSSPTPTPATKQSVPQTPADPPPSFASFSLHPAPVATKGGKDSDDRKRSQSRDAPQISTTGLQPPTSPLSTSSTTPTEQPMTPRQGDPMSPTPTIAPTKEKGHSRNLSLTSAINPLKVSLKNNKNRFSGMIGGNNAAIPPPQEEKESPWKDHLKVNNKRDVSPNPSVTRSTRSRLSWVGTTTTVETQSTESGSIGQAKETGLPLMTSQNQVPMNMTIAEAANLKQQQLQLRPPILGIQPTFVSSSTATTTAIALGGAVALASPFASALSPRAPTEISENMLQGQRALMYVWLVRRWLKKRETPSLLSGPTFFLGDSGGIFGKPKHQQGASGHSVGGHSAEPSGTNAPPSLPNGGVEVRFEWKRAKGKDAKKGKAKQGQARGRDRTPSRRRKSSVANGAESDGEVERSSVREKTRERSAAGVDMTPDAKERLKKEEKKRNRMSTGSFSTTNASQESGFRLRREATRDDGDESDPEDSETPWVCTLKVRRSAAANNPGARGANPVGVLSPAGTVFSAGVGADGNGGAVPLEPQVLRLKVGTLSPTPHHPKVVGMLKVPFPLPDIEVERMGIVKRNVARPNADHEEEKYGGITLTAEEIKDVVCSTGMWLVVREGFGGVGKVSRKGDGWRIRA